jgi:hypothetical protein
VLEALDENCAGEVLLVGIHTDRTAHHGGTSIVVGNKTFRFIGARVPSPRTQRGSNRLGAVVNAIRERRAITTFGADVVYVHNPELCLTLGALLPKVPRVLHLHGLDLSLRRSRFPATRGKLLSGVYTNAVVRRAMEAASVILATAPAEDVASLGERLGWRSCLQRRLPICRRLSGFGSVIWAANR